MKRIILFFILITYFDLTYSQLKPFTVGDAIILGEKCFQITPDGQNKVGGVWYNNPIDFSKSFIISYQNNFGSSDSGADGMAIVFKNSSNLTAIGGNGDGIGYRGIRSSLIVEFDTHQNESLGDPVYDHVSLMKNGRSDHNLSNNISGPVQASGTSENIEDDLNHEIIIQWIAETQTFKVFFDCGLRLTKVEDFKNTVFKGANSVFFGFVGSTGAESNIQAICFNYISFVDGQIDKSICSGESIQVDTSVNGGRKTYSWAPTTGVSNPSIANPTLSPLSTTLYTVSITNDCGITITRNVSVEVTPKITPTFTQVNDICQGNTLDPLPTTSNNGITGSWSPALNNMTTTTYTFTPNTGKCVESVSMKIVVNPKVTPTFTQVDDICQGNTLNPLPTTSNNGITGSWSPAPNNMTTTIYTFTPNSGECVENTNMRIVVNPKVTPTFTQVDDICEGNTLNPLPTTSNNGITGSWSPALNNMTTTTYTFTPNAGECTENPNVKMRIVVNPKVTPTFTQVTDICEGNTLDPLPTTSNNGITGSWSPAPNNMTTTTYTFTPNAGECAENTNMRIVVNPKVTPTFTQVADICEGNTLNPLPTTSNNGITGSWSPALNNMTTTTYTFTPNAGECTENPNVKMRIVVNPKVTPTFTQVTDICEGNTLNPLPTTSNNGITGSWSPAPNNMTTTTYTFTPNAGECAENTDMKIVVNPKSRLLINTVIVSNNFDTTKDVEVIVSGGNRPYRYRLDGGVWQTSNLFKHIKSCQEYIIHVMDTSICSTEQTTIVNIIEYPKFFTPNGDSFNDTWNIDCLQKHPEAFINIFDRYGKILKKIKPSGKGWDGTYNGKLMPKSDYWFVATYLNSDGTKRQIKSHFSLLPK